ncbi:helix-turn-helix domain-containing protein [Photobacterium sanguinicancri]|uniref:Helix-turn-helix transcriptional regulator n=1 Tax=Photobacterium sanguinicancri TaxID=875932 RepID=A0AAW7Y333_9GAMM|nr:helix-turn-helix transcriptional regulator [Photobacterium sanguinicancri]MDO6542799.1 helix-turn-helix transcriptional regulator [Photobacterium sanguinicancri]
MKQLVTYNALVGYELEKQRKQLGLEQADLVERTGMSQPVLSRVEKGKASITIDQLFLLCQALKVEPFEIIRNAQSGVEVLKKEESIAIQTTKQVSKKSNEAGALLAGAALGAVLGVLLTRNK